MTFQRYRNRYISPVHQELRDLFNFSPALSDDDSSQVATSEWLPRVDIKEEQDHFLITADIPGVDPKDIKISMEKNMITIQGERQTHKKEEGKNYSRLERETGTFYRRFSLPDTANAERISAKSKHGVLAVTIPKREQSQARNISIHIDQE